MISSVVSLLPEESSSQDINPKMERHEQTLFLRHEGSPSSMRDRSHINGRRKEGRKHIIHRIYGPDNALTRKHIRDVEERMERSKSGISNPNHKLNYENHPYESRNQIQRSIQSSESSHSSSSSFKPIRIHFETGALDNMRDSSNAAKIDFVKGEILPKTAEFWSLALSVIPVSGNLLITTSELDNRIYCGDSEFSEVPSEHISQGIPNADLVLYVSGTPSSRFCAGTTLAVAVACNFDQYDRPTAGAVVSKQLHCSQAYSAIVFTYQPHSSIHFTIVRTFALTKSTLEVMESHQNQWSKTMLTSQFTKLHMSWE
jgi:Leishmanolysin